MLLLTPLSLDNRATLALALKYRLTSLADFRLARNSYRPFSLLMSEDTLPQIYKAPSASLSKLSFDVSLHDPGLGVYTASY